MDDPWEVCAFDELHCGHGLHQDTLLGNSDAIAGATLTALWVFLLPIFKELLNRRKQQKVTKVYFFLAFVYIRYYQPQVQHLTQSFGSAQKMSTQRSATSLVTATWRTQAAMT